VLFPRTHNPGFYDRVLAAFARANVTPRIAEEVWPRAKRRRLVRAGLGATFMCPSEDETTATGSDLSPARRPGARKRLVIGWRGTPPPDPALAAFLAVAALRKQDRNIGRSTVPPLRPSF